jgi:4-amino-4-deoxy-L-arabinose transferase-like glycosyltransferase
VSSITRGPQARSPKTTGKFACLVNLSMDIVRRMNTTGEFRIETKRPVPSRVRRFSPLVVLAAILLLGLTLRLIHLTAPLLGHHSWRQTDTAAIARNFVEEKFNLFYPRVDWRRDSSWEVESEFPAFTFLTACAYRVFGIHEWIGRAIAIAFSLLGIFFWHRLVRLLAGETTALWSAFFLAILPLPVFFGRAFMPESLLLASLAGGLYFYNRYDRSGSWAWLL